MKWISVDEKLPMNGELVFIADWGATELAKTFVSGWYTDGIWRSHAVWTRHGDLKPKYWMPIPPINPPEGE